MKRILIVDRNDDVPRLMGIFIKFIYPEAEIMHTRNGELALRVLEKSEDFDLLISGVKVSTRIDGVELAAIVREKYPNIPIILMSGGNEPEKHNADIFLAEPLEMAKFLKAIASVKKPAA